MRRITAAEHRRMPWRNGGGTTSEIVVDPPSPAPGERFRYRVSIADVGRDGPFSPFEGYDRHIVLLVGAGMVLDCGERGLLPLRPLEPRAFSGDWSVAGRLVDGPVRDFNLIVDRAHATSSLEVRELVAAERVAPSPGATCVVHVHSGVLEGADTADTLIFDEAVELVPRGVATLIVTRISPRRG
jgi:environmental stress-induced protein Ves